jgi:DDE superfamily endonuclease
MPRRAVLILFRSYAYRVGMAPLGGRSWGCYRKPMSEPKCRAEDYIQFLIASPSRFSCTEAAAVQPDGPQAAAHDSFRRLLLRLEPDAAALWQEARGQVRAGGLLVLDDSTLDKPYARRMDLVGWHFSGKHKKVVKGINLLTLLWTDGDRHVPCDYRLYDKPGDGVGKNGHFRQMLRAAKERGLAPSCVGFDSWYASLENLRLVRHLGWVFLTRFKSNRLVRIDFGPEQRLSEAGISAQGTLVHLPGFGQVRVFRLDTPDGDTEYWATNDLGMDGLTRQRWEDYAWRIEEYHRGLKQHCGVEACQARRGRAQRNHIGLSIRAFLRLEVHCYQRGLNWLKAKLDIIRYALKAYLGNPYFLLPQDA